MLTLTDCRLVYKSVFTHQFVIWRRQTSVEIVDLISPADYNSFICFH